MEKFKFCIPSKALVVVAHPDDETIWMGGTIMSQRNLSWTIFSLCRASDKNRAPKFKQVCSEYKARAIITDLDDEERLTINQTIPKIKEYLKLNIKKPEFDYIFTHGENGEYGHPRHIGVHLAVKELIKSGFFQPKAVFYFHYKKTDQKEFSRIRARKGAKLKINLSQKLFEKKKRIVSDIYGYDYKGIDVSYCTNPESFIFNII